MMLRRRLFVLLALGGVLFFSMLSLFPHQEEEIQSYQHTHPVDIQDRCLSIRVRHERQTMALEEGIQYLQDHHKNQQLTMGMTLYEDNNDFWSYKKGKMHMFHFLEFLVYGYMAFFKISGGDGSSFKENHNLHIAWVHAPYFSRNELRGNADTNQLFTNLALGQSSSAAVTMRGLEDNDELTRGLHPSFQGVGPKDRPYWWRQWTRPWAIPNRKTRTRNWREMTHQVDAVLFINRLKCDSKRTGQMHAKLADPGVFPAQAWYKDIQSGLTRLTAEMAAPHHQLPHPKLVACYIDRQSSGRKMPPKEHEWLIDTLNNHDKVELKQLRMEKYSGLKQIQLASQCDMILGVHGNGLSHQLWMPPGSSIVEYYWDFGFVYCYAILAKMMNHRYLGLWRGKQIAQERVMSLDPELLADLHLDAPLESAETTRKVFLEFLERALSDFEQKRIATAAGG